MTTIEQARMLRRQAQDDATVGQSLQYAYNAMSRYESAIAERDKLLDEARAIITNLDWYRHNPTMAEWVDVIDTLRKERR